MEDKVVIKQSFLKQLLLTVLGLIMFLCSLFIVFIENNYFYVIIGIVSVLFFGICLVSIIKCLIMPKNILTIDSYGFIDNSTAMSGGKMVYWSQVEDIAMSSVCSQKFICVKLKNPNEYLQGITPLQKALTKANLFFSFYIIQINLNSTTAKHEEVFEVMNSYFLAYHAK